VIRNFDIVRPAILPGFGWGKVFMRATQGWMAT
jgi:hypothetical protein